MIEYCNIAPPRLNIYVVFNFHNKLNSKMLRFMRETMGLLTSVRKVFVMLIRLDYDSQEDSTLTS